MKDTKTHYDGHANVRREAVAVSNNMYMERDAKPYLTATLNTASTGALALALELDGTIDGDPMTKAERALLASVLMRRLELEDAVVPADVTEAGTQRIAGFMRGGRAVRLMNTRNQWFFAKDIDWPATARANGRLAEEG